MNMGIPPTIFYILRVYLKIWRSSSVAVGYRVFENGKLRGKKAENDKQSRYDAKDSKRKLGRTAA